MEDEAYFLFKENRRFSVKEGDLTIEKIARLFQVKANTVYISDPRNMAIFPGPDGWFNTCHLISGGHYEVFGESTTSGKNFDVPPPSPRFSFTRAETTAPSTSGLAKMYQRSLHIASEIRDGKPIPSQTIVIRFKEAEATVSGMVGKAMEALATDEPLLITDSQGNQILESSGTTGSVYWKQNSRKIFVVKETDFREQREQRDRAKRRRSSPRDDELVCLQEVSDKIEDVLLSAQGLGGVAASLRSLSQLGNGTKCLVVSCQQAEEFKSLMSCLVCKGPMNDPAFTTCCSSLIGCWACVEQWGRTSAMCLKCRGENFTLHRVNGLAEVFTIFKDMKCKMN